MDFSGIYAGAGTIIGVAISKIIASRTSKKTEHQLTKSTGENGASTIRRMLERIEERGVQSDARLGRLEVHMDKLNYRVEQVEHKQDTAAAGVIAAVTASTIASAVASPGGSA